MVLYKKFGELFILRCLVIRRKNSSEFVGKYLLNKDGNGDEIEGVYRIFYVNIFSLGDKRE